MKYFYIIGNTEKTETDAVAGQIQSFLEARGAVCRICNAKDPRRSGYRYTDPQNIPADTECVITLGGDGTMIQAARDLAERNLAMIGINLGHLGYLAQIGRKEDLSGPLEDLLEDRFIREHRMMLQGTIRRQGKPDRQELAFNEIVITRQGALKLIRFRVRVNGELLGEYRADGMIIATPSGSTAYNLSAGGPIVEPHASLMILTPVCPHELSGRSIVLSAEDCIEVEVLGEEKQEFMAYFDGDTGTLLKSGDRVAVKRSPTDTVLIKRKGSSFLETLRQKLAK